VLHGSFVNASSDVGVERSIWLAYLWGRRRVRDIDTGLCCFQAPDNSVRHLERSHNRHLTRTSRTETETVIHSDSAFATVAYLRIKSAHLVEKDMSAVPVMHFTNIPLDSAALNIRDAVRGLDLGTWAPPLVGW
jgi:hypothetical protein